MDRDTKNLMSVTIKLASAVVLKYIQNEMIIVDKDGKVIEGATQIPKPNAKNLGDEMIDSFLKAGIDLRETEEEKMYQKAVQIVNEWLK